MCVGYGVLLNLIPRTQYTNDMQEHKIIQSLSFYTRTEDSEVEKYVLTIKEKETGFLNMRKVYYAEVHSLKDKKIKSLPIGDRKTQKTEWTNLNELIKITHAYFNNLYKGAEDDEKNLAVTQIRHNDPHPLDFNPPAFTVSNIINATPDNIHANSPLNDLLKIVKDRLGPDAKLEMFTPQYSGAKILETPPTPPPIPQHNPANFQHIEDNLQALEKKGPKYQALCKQYGKKKIDALINNVKNKNKK